MVCGDLAQYARGSTGEQTQGAGAVAMLVERRPRLFAVDLDCTGTASDYRGIDFRKPFARHFMPEYGATTERHRDFPVFNGRYSTHCYIDAVLHALDAMFERIGGDRLQVLDTVAGVFLHRPYHLLPYQAMAAALARAIAREDAPAFETLCADAGIDPGRTREELLASPRLFEQVTAAGPNVEVHPHAQRLFKDFAKTARFEAFTREKMSLGAEQVRDLGNLYTASLPAWLAAAFDDALCSRRDLDGRHLLAVGYGSGDSAEALPLRVVEGWKEAAARIRFDEALADFVDLDRDQYAALHEGRAPDIVHAANTRGFVIAEIGRRNDPDFQDVGIEYYRFVG